LLTGASLVTFADGEEQPDKASRAAKSKVRGANLRNPQNLALIILLIVLYLDAKTGMPATSLNTTYERMSGDQAVRTVPTL